MMVDLCGPSEYLRFGLSFFAMGYMTIMLFYVLYLFLDKSIGWKELDCECDGDFYYYHYCGNKYKGKVFSITSELPFEENVINRNIDHCYIKEKKPMRSRAVNNFDRYGTFSAMLLGAPLIMGAIDIFLPICFRDQVLVMILLLSIGAIAAILHVAIIRLVNISVKIS
jgi:hypothetical protein